MNVLVQTKHFNFLSVYIGKSTYENNFPRKQTVSIRSTRNKKLSSCDSCNSLKNST